MKNGKFYGKGKCTFNDGEIIGGEWKAGQIHGEGTKTKLIWNRIEGGSFKSGNNSYGVEQEKYEGGRKVKSTERGNLHLQTEQFMQGNGKKVYNTERGIFMDRRIYL